MVQHFKIFKISCKKVLFPPPKQPSCRHVCEDGKASEEAAPNALFNEHVDSVTLSSGPAVGGCSYESNKALIHAFIRLPPASAVTLPQL